jgi:hypothetical protein
MNLKTHKKGLIALALVFFMIMPMFAAVNLAKAGTDTAAGSFAVYQTGTAGTTDVSSFTVPASPNPIGTYVYFDIYIYNAANVWGWSISTVSWNPSVLQLISATEGPWLKNNVADASTDYLAPGGNINNVLGVFSGGISEACTEDTVASTSAGVVTTLKFEVSGYGTSPITIAGGTLADNSEDAGANNYATATSMSSASVTVEAPPLSISLVPHGATSGSTIVWPSNENPVGSTFQVDAYIAGIISSDNLWGWNLGVSWNPAVLECTAVTEGSYLDNGTSGITDFAAGYVNNAVGAIQGGVSDAFNTYESQSVGAGVLMTLTFQILSYGSCSITLSPGTPATLLNNAYPHAAITGATLNNLAYSWTPLPATAPVASAAVTNSPFGSTSDNTFTLYGITLSGANSAAGINTEPPGQTCPITTYSWSITLIGASTPITMTGETVSLTDSQIGATPGFISATLTVTAPSPTGTPAPTYVDTASTTTQIQVESPTPGGILDIWTQTGGQGFQQSASSVGPQQLVDLYAYVSYNGAPVADKTVTFQVTAPNGQVFYTTAATDLSGMAVDSYRIPWPDSNPTSDFGVVSVYGTVDVAQVLLNDTVNFYYGYQLQVDKVVITNGDTQSGTPTFDRYGMAGTDHNPNDGNIVTATVSVTNTMWTSQTFWLSAVIYDNNSVPVAQFLAQETIQAATPFSGLETSANYPQVTQTYQITLTIPTWAYVGAANLYVNIFNSTSASSLQNALAFSPQVSAPLEIGAGTPPGCMENPGSGVLVAPTQVVNIVYTVQNDEDTGIYGYWALDNYQVNLQVWSLGSNQYQFVAQYKGTFTTFNGDLSPQTGTTESSCPSTGATGTLIGQIVGTFTATTFDPDGPLSNTQLTSFGTIATPFNFGGTQADLLLGTYSKQSGDPTYNSATKIGYTDVVGLYFPGYSNLNNQEWGFTYNYGNTVIQSGLNAGQPDMNHIWNNNSALNTGDIIVQDA